ncbi:transposase [Paenibacillus sp. GYB004]|uniref:transposase n=1 Tax=Paenibacillus sp. GYB004 TaxID=2994393 RepID=UPI002F96D73C
MARNKWETHVLPKLELIRNWARSGLIEKQIAKNLDIAYSTFNLYKEKYPELLESLKVSKEEADYEVVNSLYRRANGYEYDETTYEPQVDADGNPILNEDGTPRLAVTKVVRKQVAPDTTAQIFWLKNRDPKNWRDRQHINHSGGVVSKVVDYSHLSDEELDKELERYGDD